MTIHPITKKSDDWGPFIDGVRYIGMTMLSVAEFGQIADNPRQRDTVRRAKYSKARHLKTAKITHREVKICHQLDSSEVFKISGHTRAKLWDSGHPCAWETLMVLNYECESRAGVLDLYDLEDSMYASETFNDLAYGAAREVGIVFESSFMKQTRYQNALRKAWVMIGGSSEPNAI